jgi:hypothetical protein
MGVKNPYQLAVATKDYFFTVELLVKDNFVIFKFPDSRTITIDVKEFGGLPHKINGEKGDCVSIDEFAQPPTE